MKSNDYDPTDDDNGKSPTGLGVFFIGLALMFITGWWWPGIMFVLAASNFADGLARGLKVTENRSGLTLLAIGTIFLITNYFNWAMIVPLGLIGMGIYLIFFKDKINKDDHHLSGNKVKISDLIDEV